MSGKPPLASWQVWYVNLDPTVDNEQAGDRPAVVISSDFHLRMCPTLVTIVPLTSRERPLRHRVAIQSLAVPCYAITEQIRTLSRSRLRRPLGTLESDEIAAIRAVLTKFMDLEIR